MNPTTQHTFNSPHQPVPLALIFSSRRLLAEKASVAANNIPLAVVTETLTIRATMVTGILKEIPGYSHALANERASA